MNNKSLERHNTFFINTSRNKLINIKEIMDILHETNQLIQLECSMESWEDKRCGYSSCVKRMGDIIDSYEAVGNDFSLIVYVDLLEFSAYRNISYADENESERDARGNTLHILIRRYIRKTLLRGLADQGRNPSKILVIFDEYNGPSSDNATIEQKFKDMMTVLGLPAEKDDVLDCVDKFKECNEGLTKNDSTFGQKIYEWFTKDTEPLVSRDICSHFKNEIISWATRLYSGEMFDDVSNDVFSAPQNDGSSADGSVVKSVAFRTNRGAASLNQSLRVKRELMLCVYLLDCAFSGTFFESTDGNNSTDGQNNKMIKELVDLDWDTLTDMLNKKLEVYKRKQKEAEKKKGRFSEGENKLAPALMKMDTNRFGLDEYGDIKTETKIVSKKIAVSDVEETDDDTLHGGDIAVPIDVEQQQVLEFEAKVEPPFDGFESFDSAKPYNPSTELSAKSTFEQFEKEVIQLKRYHLEHFKKLDYEVGKATSNYAGKSIDNTSAWLDKRIVSMADADLVEDKNKYRYTHKNGEKLQEDPADVVKGFADKAYKSLMHEYLEFSAARSVALEDIEEQCSRFATKIEQVRRSLKKLWIAGLFMWIALIFIYAPFVVSQWFDFISNTITKMLFVGSFILPAVLLYSVFAVLKMRQMRRCFEAWKELLEESNKLICKNNAAVKAYEVLLSTKIPSFRAGYEHMLDVEFHIDCCRMATAKLEHHTQKLRDRITEICNILSDLGVSVNSQISTAGIPDEIDYRVPFCVGKTNYMLYTVIDDETVQSITKAGKKTDGNNSKKRKGGLIDGITEVLY